MYLKITGDYQEVYSGICALAQYKNFELNDQGMIIDVQKNQENKILIYKTQEGFCLSYDKKADFFRGLSILLKELENKKADFFKEEKRRVNSNGVMFDMSRNAVMKTENVKEFIRYMACMGLDTFYIYMEDVYELEGYPYFGYMRGAYSKKELKEIDSYAQLFSIEVVPVIQTLGHMEKTLKWRYTKDIQDTPNTLLVGEPETYVFIDKMIQTVSDCFSSRKIHIGMDEAYGLGTGAYLKKHGHRNPYDIMSEHLIKVVEIVRKYGLEPMMWSDMYMTLGSQNGTQYDPECKLPDNIQDMIPQGMQMVYWDYYLEDEKKYDMMFKLHEGMGRKIVFAGGIWLWGNVAANYGRTFRATREAFKACRKHNIKDVFATVWGDDGCETSRYQALLGMQLFAEYSYYDEVSDEHLEEMFQICTGYDAYAFKQFDVEELYGHEELSQIDDIWSVVPVAKQMLYQDVLLGVFDENYRGFELERIYKSIWEKLVMLPEQGKLEYLFSHQRKLIEVLWKKCQLGIRIYDAYQVRDLEKLADFRETVLDVKKCMTELHKSHGEVWLRENKPFGLEVLDLRYGGVIARLERAAKRLDDYINGRIERIEELEITRLPYNNNTVNHEGKVVYEWLFSRITSVQTLEFFT